MTEEQSSYVPFRNGQRDSCDRASQGAAFDLEKYGPYIDKIRALFVPSLEYRIRSLLEEFVYSADSRSARRFPRFKRFVDAMATWKGPLNKIAEHDTPNTTEELIKSVVNCALKDDLITCFLDSIVLHHRLNKICRGLDALGIEDNILRSLNVWNFANERDYRANRDRFMKPDIAASCNRNSSVATRHDAERPAGREKVVERLTTSDVYCAGSTEHVRPIAPDVLLDSDLLRQVNGNRNHQVYPATGSQRGDIDETCEFPGERSRAGEAEKIRSASSLKLIVRKMYLEDCGCSTLFKPLVARLPLPCKSADLIGRIFEADPSLTESCLIVMRRKFQVSVRNVCSCLNDVLAKLNVEASCLATRTLLHLSCEIRPGYISFKLKADSVAGCARKCLFVARIPICENAHKRTQAPPDSAVSSCNAKLRGKAEESKCPERCEGNDDTDALECIEGALKSEGVDSTRCSRLDQNLIQDTAIDRGMNSNSAERTSFPCLTNEFHIPKREHGFTIYSRNESSEKIVETVSDVTSRPEKRNEEHLSKTLATSNAIENCNKNKGEGGKSDDSIEVRNNEPAQLADGIHLAKTNSQVENIFSNQDSNSLPQDLDKRDWTRSSSEELDSGSADCSCANSFSSIASFVQNSERDKQLVELNCNRISNNNVDGRSNTADVDLLNSARAEIGCDCSCCYDDFVDITVIDDASQENACLALATFRSKSKPRNGAVRAGTTKMSSKDKNSLTISVQTPRLKVSSKGVSVDISYPRTVAPSLASGDDRSVSSNMCNEATTDLRARLLTIPKKGDGTSHNVNKRVLDPRGFISPFRTRDVSKERSGSRLADGTSTEQVPRAGDYSTNLTSHTCHSFAKDRTTKPGRFQKSRESRRLRLRYVRASSSSGVHSVTSVTTFKYRTTPRKKRDDYPADMRPRAALVTNRFRKSVIDKSVRWIKRLIRIKLAGAFFNHRRAKARSDESVGDIERRTAGGYVRQCRGRGRTSISHVESSDVTLPCHRRNWGKERSEGGIKLRDRRLAGGGSEVLSSFRSIDTISPWSYDLLTVAPWQELDGDSRRRLGKEEAKSKRGLINYNGGTSSRDYEKSIKISLRSSSAAMSLADDDSAEYFERGARKQRKAKIRGDRNRRASEAGRRGDERREPHGGGNADDESSKLSFVRTDEARDASRGSLPRSRNIARRPSSLGKNRGMLDKGVEMDRLRVFAFLVDTCHDCARDLDLEFESTLSQYVQLCGSVKRSLMRTLDNIYQVSTASVYDGGDP